MHSGCADPLEEKEVTGRARPLVRGRKGGNGLQRCWAEGLVGCTVDLGWGGPSRREEGGGREVDWARRLGRPTAGKEGGGTGAGRGERGAGPRVGLGRPNSGGSTQNVFYNFLIHRIVKNTNILVCILVQLIIISIIAR